MIDPKHLNGAQHAFDLAHPQQLAAGLVSAEKKPLPPLCMPHLPVHVDGRQGISAAQPPNGPPAASMAGKFIKRQVAPWHFS